MPDWGLLLSVLALLGGLVRWLLGYWMKSQKDLEDLKSSHTASAFRNLEITIGDHKVTIHDLNGRLIRLESELKLAVVKLDAVKQDTLTVHEAVKEFVKKSDEKINHLATENVQLAKEVILVRNKINGRTTK